MWTADRLSYREEICFIRAYWGSELVWERPSNNCVIYYTSTDGNIVTPYRNGRGGTGEDYTAGFGANIISNVYVDGLGIITFDDDIDRVYFGFNNCSTLRTVILPASVTEIGVSAFDSCTSLVSVNIPAGVTTIDWLAFYACSSLTSIEIPGLVTYIGVDSFRNCSSLTEVLVNPVNPPVIEPASTNRGPFDNNASGRLIKVPSGSVQAYKTDSEWSRYASDIVAQ